jgi:hypothetical protein
MSEGHERQQAPETGDENASDTIHEAATGAEGTNPAQGTPPLEGGGQQPG